jgi:hypothetical protein
MNYDNIPRELKEFNQFVVWRLEDKGGPKPTKVPYNPKNGFPASVTNPNHWSSFDEAIRALEACIGDEWGLGFVLTADDPFAFVDLDDSNGDPETINLHNRIYEGFDSYAELSPSGKGLHIIVKGVLPKGRRKSFVEIYSNERYMTLTGNCCPKGRRPVTDQQEKLDILFEQMGGLQEKEIYDPKGDEVRTDEQIIEIATNAANGDKFHDLLTGDWQGYYQSQSEADFALINIVAHYTDNRDQIVRIFRNSALGQRDKAKRDNYVGYMVRKSFDRKIPPMDFSTMLVKGKNAREALQAEETINQEPVKPAKPAPVPTTDIYCKPPSSPNGFGLIGEIADYIYTSAPRPVYEFALCGAIGLMAGICGKAYNVSGTGLNQYILGLGNTGVGKEGMGAGVSRLINAMRFEVPQATDFIGPGEIASGQALHRYLNGNSQSIVSVVGEFGIKLQQITHPRASTAEVSLKRALLDFFNKSGAGSIVYKMAYADKDKNTDDLKSPAFSILGESTPCTFFEALDESMLADGLITRFTMIEYDGKRPPFNKNHSKVKVSKSLKNHLKEVFICATHLNTNDEVKNVEETPEAAEYLDWIDRTNDDKMNGATNEITRNLWNRTHIKTWKLAALVAVGDRPHDPVITREMVEWAYRIVVADAERMSDRFSSGEVGSNNEEIQQFSAFIKAVRDYMTLSYKEVAKYRVRANIHTEGIIPVSYLQQRLGNLVVFKKDRMRSSEVVNKLVQSMEDNGDIVMVRKHELAEKFDFRGKAFVIENKAMFSGR